MAEVARDLRVDGTLLITVAAEQTMSLSNEMLSIVSEPRSRNMFVTPTLGTVVSACSGVLCAVCYGTLGFTSVFFYIVLDSSVVITLL